MFGRTVSRLCITAIFLLLLGLGRPVFAQSFTYSGALPAAVSGSYDFQFKLFHTPTGGAQTGPTLTTTTAVSAGKYTVTLDFGNAFSGAPLYMQISYRPHNTGTYNTITGRVPLTTSFSDLSQLSLNTLAIQGTPVSPTAPTTGQVLKFDGTQWSPGTDIGSVYSAGAGLSLSNNVFSIANGGVVTSMLADGSVTAAKISWPLLAYLTNGNPLLELHNSGGGAGVYATSSNNFGVYGYSGYIGVAGDTDSGTGGQFRSNSGTGLFAFSTSSTGAYGTSNTGNGVRGSSQSGIGGLFQSFGSGSGVRGESSTGIGVVGFSSSGSGGDFYTGGSGSGVYASSGSGNGVEGRSDSGTAVFGLSRTGMGGDFWGDGSAAGVRGQSSTGTGGDFYSSSSTGGIGASGQSANGIGVFGGTQGGYGGEFYASGVGYGVYCQSNTGYAGDFFSQSSYGVYGRSGSSYAGYFQGSLYASSASASIKQFLIDHPQDPANKYLVHSSVESDERRNIYDGTVLLDGDGRAWVVLPTWFEALNRDFRYQLTAIGGPGPNLHIAQKIHGSQFQIAGGAPGLEVSWQVTGIRQDAYANAHPLIAEQPKSEEERGKYLNPKELGMPEELGINYERQHRLETDAAARRKKP